MKSISKILVTGTILLSFISCDAQIKNSKTDTVKIYGNCGMCEKTIETAGTVKNVAIVDWNKDTKMATITYDSTKTTQDEIMKRIALSGYDSDTFLAPDTVYAKLPGCCQYDRTAKVAVKNGAVAEDHSNHANHNEMAKVDVPQGNQLKAVFDSYFAIKEALVKTDGSAASSKATSLISAINAVKMETLTPKEHTVWMKVLKSLKEDASHIADTKDAKQQRDYFDTLSKSIYELIKVSKQDTPTYLQHCPMANDGKGGDWLSKENVVKNPYYGSMMLSCGKVTETIK